MSLPSQLDAFEPEVQLRLIEAEVRSGGATAAEVFERMQSLFGTCLRELAEKNCWIVQLEGAIGKLSLPPRAKEIECIQEMVEEKEFGFLTRREKRTAHLQSRIRELEDQARAKDALIVSLGEKLAIFAEELGRVAGREYPNAGPHYYI